MDGFAWEALWLTPLEQGLNRYLKLDPAWPSWLAPLQHKTLAVTLRPPQLRTVIYVSQSGLRLSLDANAPVDAEIIGAPSTFVAYLLTQRMSPLMADGRLQLIGDLQLVQAFEALMRQVQPDWEALLASVTGDTLAYRVGQCFKRVRATSARGCELLGRQLTDYLQDELALLPAGALLTDFYAEVDKLRQATERMAARVALLRRTFHPIQTGEDDQKPDEGFKRRKKPKHE